MPQLTPEGRMPQSISDDVARVVAQLRQALRPIESAYGESSGGPDGWSPRPDEISEWEMTFREHADPANVSTLLAALTLVQQERDELRAALKLAEAALADIGDADREPGDDLAWCEARAAEALPAARKALTPKATQQEKQP